MPLHTEQHHIPVSPRWTVVLVTWSVDFQVSSIAPSTGNPMYDTKRTGVFRSIYGTEGKNNIFLDLDLVEENVFENLFTFFCLFSRFTNWVSCDGIVEETWKEYLTWLHKQRGELCKIIVSLWIDVFLVLVSFSNFSMS